MLIQRDDLEHVVKERYDSKLSAKLMAFLEQPNFQNIHCFLPMGSEVNFITTIKILLKSEKTVVCPRVLPYRKMDNLILKSINQLEDGIFGTKHPIGCNRFEGSYDLIIVPGLAFDKHGNRLGYGAGYYDAFLKKYPEALKIGVAYPFQIQDSLPVESHDIPLDKVIY